MLVSVTVEGSVGPVKAMVRLGASVGEAIAAVVERYAREGRSPRLDPAAAKSFQLHHSHFSLESKTWRFHSRSAFRHTFVLLMGNSVVLIKNLWIL